MLILVKILFFFLSLIFTIDFLMGLYRMAFVRTQTMAGHYFLVVSLLWTLFYFVNLL